MRLIDSKKILSFENWVTQHNPKMPWDFNDPEQLKRQLIEIITETGDLDIKTLFCLFFAAEGGTLTFEQNARFLRDKY